MAKKKQKRNREMDIDLMLKHISHIEELVKNNIITSQIQIVKAVKCSNLIITSLVQLGTLKRIQPEDINLRKAYVWQSDVTPSLELAQQVAKWIKAYNNRREKRVYKLTGKKRQRRKGVVVPKIEWIQQELPTVVVRIINGIDKSKVAKLSDDELKQHITKYIEENIIKV